MQATTHQHGGHRPSAGRRKRSVSIRVRAAEHIQTAITALAEVAADGAAPAVARVGGAQKMKLTSFFMRLATWMKPSGNSCAAKQSYTESQKRFLPKIGASGFLRWMCV